MFAILVKNSPSEFVDLADEFLRKIITRVLDEIVGSQISHKSLLDIGLLCHIVKFCVIDENPVINLVLRWGQQSDGELQCQVPRVHPEDTRDLRAVPAQERELD